MNDREIEILIGKSWRFCTHVSAALFIGSYILGFNIPDYVENVDSVTGRIILALTSPLYFFGMLRAACTIAAPFWALLYVRMLYDDSKEGGEDFSKSLARYIYGLFVGLAWVFVLGLDK